MKPPPILPERLIKNDWKNRSGYMIYYDITIKEIFEVL
jgi:hypothetical protein